MTTATKITQREAALLDAVMLANKMITEGPESYNILRKIDRNDIERGLLILNSTQTSGRSQDEKWKRADTIRRAKKLLREGIKAIDEYENDTEEKNSL